MSTPPRLVVLISGSGTNLQALIDAAASGQLGARVAAVISNRADAGGLERARRAGIPGHVLEHRQFPTRAAFDDALTALIDAQCADLVALAGFMRILTPDFVRHFRGQLLNIHPSLLPKYPGLHTHQRALEAGDRETGATVHFVTEELDGGPPVIQGRVPILPGDDVDTLAARVRAIEHRIYPLAVQWLTSGRLVLAGQRALLDGRPLPQTGYQHGDPQAD